MRETFIGSDVTEKLRRGQKERRLFGREYKRKVFNSLFNLGWRRRLEGIDAFGVGEDLDRVFKYFFRSRITRGQHEFYSEDVFGGLHLDLFRFPPDSLGVFGAVLLLRKPPYFLATGVTSHIAVDTTKTAYAEDAITTQVPGYGVYELHPLESPFVLFNADVPFKRANDSKLLIPEFGVVLEIDNLLSGTPVK